MICCKGFWRGKTAWPSVVPLAFGHWERAGREYINISSVGFPAAILWCIHRYTLLFHRNTASSLDARAPGLPAKLN